MQKGALSPTFYAVARLLGKVTLYVVHTDGSKVAYHFHIVPEGSSFIPSFDHSEFTVYPPQ